jgi:ribonuclease P protein component
LRGAAAFARLFRQGRRIDAEHLQLLAMPAGGAIGQVGYVIGKQQLKLAVDRNRLKRMLREAVRRRRPALDHFDIVLRLRRGCAPAGIAAVRAEAARLLDALTTAKAQ